MNDPQQNQEPRPLTGGQGGQQQDQASGEPGENRELFRLHAAWYANLPPPADELVIQEKSVHLIHRDLFERKVESMPVKDIAHVHFSSIPLFAALEIVGNDSSHTLKITGVPRQQAMQAKGILEGLILAKSGEVKVPQGLQPKDKREQLVQQASVPFDTPPQGQ